MYHCLKDLMEMPDKDSTLVGEKGMSLSGGQRARLGLYTKTIIIEDKRTNLFLCNLLT